MARSKKACIVFFDEVDAIGGARFDDGVGGDNEVQRTMLEIVNQLDGFDARGNIKVLMATNRLVCCITCKPLLCNSFDPDLYLVWIHVLDAWLRGALNHLDILKMNWGQFFRF